MTSKDIFVVGTYIWYLNRLQQRGLLWIEIYDKYFKRVYEWASRIDEME